MKLFYLDGHMIFCECLILRRFLWCDNRFALLLASQKACYLNIIFRLISKFQRDFVNTEKSPTFVGIFNFSQNPAKFTWLQFMNLMDLRLHYKIFVNNVENKTTHKWSSLTYLYTFLIFLVHICILRTRVVKRSFFSEWFSVIPVSLTILCNID